MGEDVLEMFARLNHRRTMFPSAWPDTGTIIPLTIHYQVGVAMIPEGGYEATGSGPNMTAGGLYRDGRLIAWTADRFENPPRWNIGAPYGLVMPQSRPGSLIVS